MKFPCNPSQCFAMLLSTAVGLHSATVQAQSYPARPIRIMVGYSAGGGVDAMARLLAPRLSTQLGTPVVVENRSGASGAIAGDVVVKAPPDGYTLLLGESALLIAKHLQRLPFDPLRSFAPVAGLFSLPVMIVTTNNFPAKTPKEFITVLKANPGKFSFATSGVGTVQHLAFEMLKAQTGTFVVHIPYRGAAQIVPDIVGGQVPLAVLSAAAVIPQIKAGKLSAIAIMSPAKLAGTEDIPLLSDVLPGFNVSPRLFLLAPAGTPAIVVERLAEAVRIVLASPELTQAASLQGAVSAFMSATALATEMNRESAAWAKTIKDQNISAE